MELQLRFKAVRDRLDHVLGPGRYRYTYEHISGMGAPTILCHLWIGGTMRSGFGQTLNLQVAVENALVAAARGFGLGQAGAEVGQVIADVTFEIDVPEDARRDVERPLSPHAWNPDAEE